MQYNSTLTPLKLPEYGRNIQQMVDYCLTIEDRQERQQCAETIVRVMSQILPEGKNQDNLNAILWNHLAYMADFNLDIDYPVEIVPLEMLTRRPDKVPYPSGKPERRHYGHMIEKLIAFAAEIEDEQEREQMAIRIATLMKAQFTNWNKTSVDNYRIFSDLYEMSDGKLFLNEEQHSEALQAKEPNFSARPKQSKRKSKR